MSRLLRRRSRVALLCLLAVAVVKPCAVQAESPLNRLALFKHLEADPNKDYLLTETSGPWLVLCSTFVGEEGKAQAKKLVLELRRDYRLPAYMHNMEWKFNDPVIGRGVDMYGRPKLMKHANYAEREETGVLVGDFPTIDDPAAQKLLAQVRLMKPKCLDPEVLKQNNEKSAQALGAWRWVTSKVWSTDEEKKRMGPMGKAFMVANPLLPPEYFNPQGLDPLVVRMNEPVEFGLLNCPGKYSVKVATFTGTSISMPKEIEDVEAGRKQMKSRLEKAAINAHLLTEALRAKGYDAYEFHDHGASFVAVGSFESVGTPRPDGKIEINPEVHRIMQTFGAEVRNVNGKPTAGQAKSLAGIPFDVQPVPIEVPRRSIAADYKRTSLSRR